MRGNQNIFYSYFTPGHVLVYYNNSLPLFFSRKATLCGGQNIIGSWDSVSILGIGFGENLVPSLHINYRNHANFGTAEFTISHSLAQKESGCCFRILYVVLNLQQKVESLLGVCLYFISISVFMLLK